MKIFFDTCTIIDYLCNRNNSANVDRILQLADDNRWECIISAGSFYTITYLIELDLKHNGYSDKPYKEMLEDALKEKYSI